MTNALFDSGREGFLDGSIDWDTDTIRVIPVRTMGGGSGPYYTLDLAGDKFLSDIPDNTDCRPLGTGASTGTVLANKSVTDGVADADPADLGPMPEDDPFQLLIIYQDTGSQATSRLIHAIDTGTGLPFQPTGGSVVITWDTGANKIFKL